MYKDTISTVKFLFQTIIHEIVYPIIYALIRLIIQIFVMAFLLFHIEIGYSKTNLQLEDKTIYSSELKASDKKVNCLTTSNVLKNDTLRNGKIKFNYIGITPTFIFMGMYGMVYAHAINEKHILTGVGGYTNFDLSPVPFLHNDKWIYENIYLGLNFTIFPFSDMIFPRGFYYGFDFVPSLGFWKKRETGKKGTALGLSADILAGYSWILKNNIKLSVDFFINSNPPGIKFSGEQPGGGKWVILPFFDFNVGKVF
jgi:hypothetical protein